MINYMSIKDWTPYIGKWIVWEYSSREYKCDEIKGVVVHADNRGAQPSIKGGTDVRYGGVHPSRIVAMTDAPVRMTEKNA